MCSKTRLIGGIGLAVAVGVSVSSCASTRKVTTFPTTPITTATTTRDPATDWLAEVGPGDYRVLTTLNAIKDPRGVAADPGAHKMYVVSSEDKTVYVIDTVTRTVTANIPVGVHSTGTQPMAVDPNTHLVYLIPNGSDGKLSIIDPNTRTVTAKVPAGGDPSAVAIDAERHTIYVANHYYKTVTAIDSGTHAVVATIPVGAEPNALAVDPSSHQLWVVNGKEVSVVDPGPYTVSATIPVGDSPEGIAIDPATHMAYVTDIKGHSVSLIDIVSRTAAGTISLGLESSLAVAVDPAEHTVYLTTSAFGSVTMIDTNTRKVTAVRRSGRSGHCTWGIAVDTATHHVYITNCKPDPTVEVIAHN